MRKLVYDCYLGTKKIKSVATYEEALDWGKGYNQTYRASLIETKVEKEEELEWMRKRIEKVKARKAGM